MLPDKALFWLVCKYDSRETRNSKTTGKASPPPICKQRPNIGPRSEPRWWRKAKNGCKQISNFPDAVLWRSPANLKSSSRRAGSSALTELVFVRIKWTVICLYLESSGQLTSVWCVDNVVTVLGYQAGSLQESLQTVWRWTSRSTMDVSHVLLVVLLAFLRPGR